MRETSVEGVDTRVGSSARIRRIKVMMSSLPIVGIGASAGGVEALE
jgi:chemotaxis response regulator CheB